MMQGSQYILIKSGIPTEVLEYLGKKGLDFTAFPLANPKDLSQIPQDKRNFGDYAWKDCDNFIEGTEWDKGLKPETERQKQGYDLEEGRGWQIFLCKAYKGKPTIFNHSMIPDEKLSAVIQTYKENTHGFDQLIDSEDGETNNSWLICNHCVHYSPRTLEGRKKIAELSLREYQRLSEETKKEIERLGKEIATSQVSEK